MATVDGARTDPEPRHLLDTTETVSVHRLLTGRYSAMHAIVLEILGPMLDRARRWGELRAEVDNDRSSARRGRGRVRLGAGCLERVVSDELVDALSITGIPDECRRNLADFGDRLPHVILHTPYVTPLRQEESADAFRAIVESFVRRAPGAGCRVPGAEFALRAARAWGGRPSARTRQ